MRNDMAKALTESYRVGGGTKFRDLRKREVFNDDEYGRREGMRFRYKVTWSAKEFGEHLAPLRGWLRTCLGKNWDDCYSELRQKFDTRKVINSHILEHLFSDIETKTVIDDDGEVCFYGGRFDSGLRPIAKCYKDYYVCPKTKIVKRTHPVNTPSRKTLRRKEREEALAAAVRNLSKNSVLRNIDGVWYHFDLVAAPEAKVVFIQPYGVTEFADQSGRRAGRKKTWDQLTDFEKNLYGRKAVHGKAYDEAGGGEVYYQRAKSGQLVFHIDKRLDGAPIGKYHTNKRTATSKELKAAGVENVYNEDNGAVNHREYAAWKKAA